MRGGYRPYRRRRGRWSKILPIDGPVDQSPAKWSVALGVIGEALAHHLQLCEQRKEAENIAEKWLDRLLVTG